MKSEWWEEWKGKGSGVERVLGEINGRAFVFGRKFKQEMLDREGDTHVDATECSGAPCMRA